METNHSNTSLNLAVKPVSPAGLRMSKLLKRDRKYQIQFSINLVDKYQLILYSAMNQSFIRRPENQSDITHI